MQGQPQESEPTQATGSTEQAGTAPITGSTIQIIDNQPLNPDTGHSTTEPTEETTGPLTASLPQDETKGTSTETTGTETGQGTSTIKLFVPGEDSETTTLGGGGLESPEVIPGGETTKQPGGREGTDPVAFRAVYTPDEVHVSTAPCDPIVSLSAEDFQTIAFPSLNYNTENPAFNVFMFSIPFRTISSEWVSGAQLFIGVAVLREGVPTQPARITTAVWNDLPSVLNPDSMFNFSVMYPRVFGDAVVGVRIMSWVSAENICVDQTGLLRGRINLTAGSGRIYPIPSEVQQPSLGTSRGEQSTTSIKQKSYSPGQDN